MLCFHHCKRHCDQIEASQDWTNEKDNRCPSLRVGVQLGSLCVCRPSWCLWCVLFIECRFALRRQHCLFFFISRLNHIYGSEPESRQWRLRITWRRVSRVKNTVWPTSRWKRFISTTLTGDSVTVNTVYWGKWHQGNYDSACKTVTRHYSSCSQNPSELNQYGSIHRSDVTSACSYNIRHSRVCQYFHFWDSLTLSFCIWHFRTQLNGHLLLSVRRLPVELDVSFEINWAINSSTAVSTIPARNHSPLTYKTIKQTTTTTTKKKT